VEIPQPPREEEPESATVTFQREIFEQVKRYQNKIAKIPLSAQNQAVTDTEVWANQLGQKLADALPDFLSNPLYTTLRFQFANTPDIFPRLDDFLSNLLIQLSTIKNTLKKSPSLAALPQNPVMPAAPAKPAEKPISAPQEVERPVAPLVEESLAPPITVGKLEESPLLNPLKPVDPEFVELIRDKIKDVFDELGEKEGAVLARDGRKDAVANGKGYFVGPTILDKVNPESRVAAEEIFGPVLAVMRAKNFEDAMQIANDIPFGLSASIQTTNVSRVFEFVNRMEAGLLTVNLPSAGVEYQLPFGGTKDSSFGSKEQGPAALEFYSDYKTVYLKY